MKEQKERASAWEDDSEGQEKKQESQEDDGREEYERREDEEEEDVGDEFTMEIMLKMAGVEERLIGWDRELSNFIKK
jgi:hypothetical protein